MSKTTNEHYVPCCYLWNFSFQKNNKSPQKSPIHVFDTVINKHFIRAVHDVSSDYGFYDIAELGEKSNVLEVCFSGFEGEYATLLKALIDGIHNTSVKRLGAKEKTSFAAHFAIQYVRTLAHRNFLSYLIEQLKTIIPQSSFYYDRITSEDYIKNLHNGQLLNMETANVFANVFEDKKWIISINKTDQPFITSDNPVCVINCGDSVGLCSLGCIIAIPICPDILIMMVDNRFPVQDRKVVEMCDIKIVDYLNKQQHNNCSRCLFSITDDFSFVHSE